MTPYDRLDEDLSDWLASGPTDPDPQTEAAVRARVRVTRQRPGWLAGSSDRRRTAGLPGAAVAGSLLLILGGVLLLTPPGRDPSPISGPSGSPLLSSPTASADTLGGHPMTRLAVAAPSSIGVGDGSLWIGTRGTEPQVLRIDPASLEAVAEIDVGGVYACGRITEAFGSVWSPHCGSGGLKRIDPVAELVTGSVQPDLGLVAVAFDGSMWTAPTTDAGDLARIDPDTATVEARLRRPEFGWWGIAAVGDSLWATSGSMLERVDPETGQVIAQVELAGALDAPLGVDGSIWVGQEGGPLIFRVDPTSATLTATIDLGTYMAGGLAQDVTGQLWVGTRQGLVRIDPVTDTIAERIEIPGGGGDGIATGFGAVWLTSEWRNEVWRIGL